MINGLTKSENEVIKLKSLGFINKEIADKRCVSIHTIKTHVKRAIKKTGVSSAYELVARYAISDPNLFRNLIVALFLSIQGLIIVPRTSFVEQRRRRIVKVSRAKSIRTKYYVTA